MKNQRNQLIALVVLVIGWAAYWHFFIKVPQTVVVAKAASVVKVAKADNLLLIRLHKVRAEMDLLYHYRINPPAFDAQWSPFRIPKGMEGSADLGGAASDVVVKAPVDSAQAGPPPDYAEKLLKSAIASMRIGGVVTLNGITQLTVDGQLHKDGDEFTAKVPTAKGQLKFVLIKIRLLSTSSVTLVLESEGGGAEIRVRLN